MTSPTGISTKQTGEISSWKVSRPELCEFYSKQIAQLPSKIFPRDLDRYAAFLFNYPYLEALATLRDVVFAPDKRLSKDKLSKIERILKQAECENTLEACASQGIPEGYHFAVVRKGGNHIDLLNMMNKIPNCIKPEEKEHVAHAIQEDINLGACIKIFGIDPHGEPKSYFRDYITLGLKGQVLLQIDAVEGGDQSFWITVGQWIENNRGKELLYGISSSLYVADALKIPYIVLGDFESDEIGKNIGCSDIKVYNPDVMKRKIGLPPRITDKDEKVLSDGIFVNRLGNGSYQRVLNMSNLRLFEQLKSSDTMIDCCDADIRMKCEKNPVKQREMELYQRAVNRLNIGI